MSERGAGCARNARRRRKYAEDPEHRERHLERNRRSYRRRRALTVGLAVTEDPARLAGHGALRHVLRGPCAGTRLTFTMRELARALGLAHPQVVHRWRRRGQVPGPVVAAAGCSRPVYLEPEVQAMARVLAAHFRRVAYFRQDHADTRARLLAEVEAARRSLGFT